MRAARASLRDYKQEDNQGSSSGPESESGRMSRGRRDM